MLCLVPILHRQPLSIKHGTFVCENGVVVYVPANSNLHQHTNRAIRQKLRHPPPPPDVTKRAQISLSLGRLVAYYSICFYMFIRSV